METLSGKLTHPAWAQQLNEAMMLKLKATNNDLSQQHSPRADSTFQ
ncbi:Uncharacterised protein [Vibrio cholerae]|nr:Uncharacterised protein [Vibrio cholerae]